MELQKKLEVLNSLTVIAIDGFNGGYTFVYVEDNKQNRSKLQSIVPTDLIESSVYLGAIDIYFIAKAIGASGYTGDQFVVDTQYPNAGQQEVEELLQHNELNKPGHIGYPDLEKDADKGYIIR